MMPGQIIQLGSPPNRIDLLTGIPHLSFREYYSSRETIKMDGLEINFIGLKGLKESKRIAGRHQDLADIENLEESSPDTDLT